jgi:hypothetical protein
MGVEPTVARSARSATSFEDWGVHRNSTTPIQKITRRLHSVKPRVSADQATHVQ